MFVALEPRRLYQRVAEQIRRLIESGELKPGDRLPAERDLAERFGVSRPTVREALIVLEVEGYLQIRIGTGVYVNPAFGISSVSLSNEENDSPFEILQARCLIESAIAEEAARRVTPESLARLDMVLNRMASALDDISVALACDRAFHTAIADMIDNGALNRFIGLIYDKRASPYFEKLASYFEGPHTWKLALEEHWLIRDGIAAKDPVSAREAMRRHLTLAEKRFSESFGGEPNKE